MREGGGRLVRRWRRQELREGRSMRTAEEVEMLEWRRQGRRGSHEEEGVEKEEWEDVIVSRERMEMWLEEGKERISSCSSSSVIDE